jgi:gamma-glutamylcyclotransferase (GGCT)/AIG2-like uncharacterized protein YtfP
LTNLDLNLPVFVYGTLLPGQPFHNLLREALAQARPATMLRSRLYDLGYYPMLVDAPFGEVLGMVYHIRPPLYPEVMRFLDRLENVGWDASSLSAYRRERRVARLADGNSVVAWVYLGSKSTVSGLSPIQGDWKAYCRTGGK